MYAIEFVAKVRDGVIQVPAAYRHRLKDNVRVILMIEDQDQDSENLIRTLMENPLTVPNFAPFTREEIYAES